ncbi:carboxypeptidase-like regulatory domain-containing protein [Algoriphagus chordae]|uniref:Carboxypeptidase-like protein n=1 Tax=Algoriphagus chordae TaxID=237019 RepID=A0A2W7RH39_9BACT|nr:carboxypeptidase-like regulatory domain-containing protein [Algoriphagus chordae]PZX54877.1 carboxypeptidase-like protein [Algoriphagus chordae]
MLTNRIKTVFVSFVILFSITPLFLVAQTFTLRGKVLDADTKIFVDGASVTLKGTAHGMPSTGGGNFKFEKVAKDKYTLNINAEGYTTYEQVVNLRNDLDLGEIFLLKHGAAGTGAAIQHSIRANNIMRLLNERPNFMGGNMIYGLPPQAAEVEGDNYLDIKWNTASLLLYKDQKMLEGYRIRYDISSNSFEMLAPESNQISRLAGLRVQNVVWVDSVYKVPRYFVNGMDFLDEGSPISGFFEVIVDGELPLMRRTMAVFKESNYNEALMIGNQNHQIIKRNIYYYLDEKNVIEVPTKRKQLYLIFGEKAEQMKEYINANALSIREPSALFQIFTYYNAMFPDFKPITTRLVEEN